jgi:hypothetical protein
VLFLLAGVRDIKKFKQNTLAIIIDISRLYKTRLKPGNHLDIKLPIEATERTHRPTQIDNVHYSSDQSNSPLIHTCMQSHKKSICDSGKWTGTEQFSNDVEMVAGSLRIIHHRIRAESNTYGRCLTITYDGALPWTYEASC